MTGIRLRPLAEADLVERSEYSRPQGGDALGERFFEALRDVEQMHGADSPRIGEMCNIDGLLSRRPARLMCDCFCFERGRSIDAVRFPIPARSASRGRMSVRAVGRSRRGYAKHGQLRRLSVAPLPHPAQQPNNDRTRPL